VGDRVTLLGQSQLDAGDLLPRAVPPGVRHKMGFTDRPGHPSRCSSPDQAIETVLRPIPWADLNHPKPAGCEAHQKLREISRLEAGYGSARASRTASSAVRMFSTEFA
jgi:hypothetical protein